MFNWVLYQYKDNFLIQILYFQPCDSSQDRQRTRSILRSPANNHDAKNHPKCPPLIEAQACHLNTTCFSYSWRHTDLGSCLPLGGSPCGEGVQSRAVFCERSDGRPVEDRLASPCCQNLS